MGKRKIETIINEKISPFRLNEKGKSTISQLVNNYPYDLLVESIDIGASQYFRYDDEGYLTQESVANFIDKLGGIAYNKSLNPIEQEIKKINNKGKASFNYWNYQSANSILNNYIRALKSSKWTDEQIYSDLKTEVISLINSSRNWSEWSSNMEKWINDIYGWDVEDDITIEQNETILPLAIFNGLQQNFQSICKQINASYEHNLYDCAAVMMRRLLEGLLIMVYQSNGIESEIKNKNGHHLTLDKIIKNAENNSELSLSVNTKNNMYKFKNLGNYSAHKIWYNTTKKDIEPLVFDYRVIIEELIYKSGLK